MFTFYFGPMFSAAIKAFVTELDQSEYVTFDHIHQ